MTTQYGVMTHTLEHHGHVEVSWLSSRESAEEVCRDMGLALVAREVSQPRVVSIRA